MLRTLALASVLAIQQAAQFDVASIRPRPEQPDREVATAAHITPSQVRFEYLSLKDCIAMAYRVDGERIVGPDWLASTRFDIAATLPTGTTPQLPAMMQTLLEQRFKLRIHRETRELPAYQLGLRKEDVKLEPAAPDPESVGQPITPTMQGSGAGIFVTLGRGATYALEKGQFEARKMTMAMFADALARFVGRPVIDATGLSGYFNVTLETPDVRIMTVRYAASVGVPVPPEPLQFANDVVPAAIGDSLRRAGFSFESRRLPLDVFVVDAIERTPTDN